MSFIENQLRRVYKAGETIFKDGDQGATMFILVDGEVEISKVYGDHEMVLATLGNGSMFGEMAIINRRPRSATAKAIKETTLLEISRDMFNKRLEEVPKWMQSFFGIMAERLRQATENQSILLAEGAGRQFANILTMIARPVERDNMDRIILPWVKTIATIAFLLGIDEGKVNDMANKLVTAKFAKSDKREKIGRVMILEMPDKFFQFADYCKEQFLFRGGHSDAMSEEFQFSTPHEVKVLEAVEDVMNEQGALDDFPSALLANVLKEKFKQPFIYFQESIDKMVSDGVIDLFQPEGTEPSYRINNRELFSDRMQKLKLIKEMRELERMLSE